MNEILKGILRNYFELNKLSGVVIMVRMFLFIFLLCFSVHWRSSASKFGPFGDTICNQSKIPYTFDICNTYDTNVGILACSNGECSFSPCVKKVFLSDFMVFDEIRSNGYYFADLNLSYYIKKDNIFLSILRI